MSGVGGGGASVRMQECVEGGGAGGRSVLIIHILIYGAPASLPSGGQGKMSCSIVRQYTSCVIKPMRYENA